jgi:hypothetical protein
MRHGSSDVKSQVVALLSGEITPKTPDECRIVARVRELLATAAPAGDAAQEGDAKTDSLPDNVIALRAYRTVRRVSEAEMRFLSMIELGLNRGD